MQLKTLIVSGIFAAALMPMVATAQIKWNKPDPATRTSADRPWIDGERDYTFYVFITIKKTTTDPKKLDEISKSDFDKAADRHCGDYSDGLSTSKLSILGSGKDKDGSPNVTLGRLYNCVDQFG